METKVKSETIFEGKIFKVHVDDVFVDKTGKIAKREIVEHHGGVGVCAVKDHKILLVRQYRYGVKEYLLEIPAGKLEDEDPMACAYREIEEETGYRANNMRLLSKFYATPGYCTELLHVYYTDDVVEVEDKLEGDEDEDLTYGWYSLDDCLEMCKNGEIKDAKTVIAVLACINEGA